MSDLWGLHAANWDSSISHDNQGGEGVYTAHDGGYKAGDLWYTLAGDKAHVDSITVHPDYRGGGVGQSLIERLHRDFPTHKINPGTTTQAGHDFMQRIKTLPHLAESFDPDWQPDIMPDHVGQAYDQHHINRLDPEYYRDDEDEDDDHHTASTNGIRYAHVVEADVAEDLHRLGMPTYYHLTDNPDFTPDPNFRPENNGTMGGSFSPGLFVSQNPEHWTQGYGYYRPYVSEIEVPDGVGSDFQNSPERFIKPEDYDKIQVRRTLPLDAYTREKWGESGPVESSYGEDFETGEKFTDFAPGSRDLYKKTPGYRYPGTAMDQTPQWREQYENRVRDYQKRTPGIIARLAMPAPMPEGITFHHHPTNDTIPTQPWPADPTQLVPRFTAPAVEARHNGKTVGYLEWDPPLHATVVNGIQYGDYPPEVSMIKVHPDYRRHGIGTGLFDFARQHQGDLEHSDSRTELGNKWVDYEQGRKTAMPAPLPKGVFFRYHPELMWSPGVTAHLPGGKQVGSLEWYDDDHVMVDLGTRRPGEIDRISVHPDHQGQSIATSMFDFAKQHEPRLHHSDQLTDDGRGWSEYERSRTAGRNGDPPPMTFEPFNTMWSNGIMARHAEDGRPIAHLHWYPDGEIESIRTHPELQGRDIAKHILAHAATHPETYEAEGGIKPSNHMTEAGRAYARSLGYNPPDEEVTHADNDVANWGWTAVKDYVPLHVPYTGQNEAEMSKYLENEWTPPSTQKTAASDEGWPVWWRGRHRPAGPFDKRWHPNHPEHAPAPWDQ